MEILYECRFKMKQMCLKCWPKNTVGSILTRTSLNLHRLSLFCVYTEFFNNIFIDYIKQLCHLNQILSSIYKTNKKSASTFISV